MKNAAILCIIVMIFASNSVSARTANYHEWRGTVSSDWNTAANWSTGDVPQVLDTPGTAGETFDKAGFKGYSGSVPASPVIGPGTAVGVDQIVIGGNGTALGGNLTIGGGTLNVSEFINIGNVAADSGVLTLNSGTINCGAVVPTEGRFIVGLNGTAVVMMNGGTLNLTSTLMVAQNATANGTLNLLDGIINAANLSMGSGTARIVIKEGYLLIHNSTDLSGTIQSWIDAGSISGAPGYTAYTAYDSDSLTTLVWATPEPATILLLGLGGVMLRKRRI